MAFQLNFRVSPETPSGPTEFFLPFLVIHCQITLIVIMKVPPQLANFISGMLRSQQKADA